MKRIAQDILAPIAAMALFIGLMAGPATYGCAPKSANLTPQAQAAYTADQVVSRLAELQNAAMAADASKTISRAVAVKIVTFTVDAAKVAKASQAGWQASVQALYTALKADVGGVFADKNVQAAWGVVAGLLGVS